MIIFFIENSNCIDVRKWMRATQQLRRRMSNKSLTVVTELEHWSLDFYQAQVSKNP